MAVTLDDFNFYFRQILEINKNVERLNTIEPPVYDYLMKDFSEAVESCPIGGTIFLNHAHSVSALYFILQSWFRMIRTDNTKIILNISFLSPPLNYIITGMIMDLYMNHNYINFSANGNVLQFINNFNNYFRMQPSTVVCDSSVDMIWNSTVREFMKMYIGEYVYFLNDATRRKESIRSEVTELCITNNTSCEFEKMFVDVNKRNAAGKIKFVQLVDSNTSVSVLKSFFDHSILGKRSKEGFSDNMITNDISFIQLLRSVFNYAPKTFPINFSIMLQQLITEKVLFDQNQIHWIDIDIDNGPLKTTRDYELFFYHNKEKLITPENQMLTFSVDSDRVRLVPLFFDDMKEEEDFCYKVMDNNLHYFVYDSIKPSFDDWTVYQYVNWVFLQLYVQSNTVYHVYYRGDQLKHLLKNVGLENVKQCNLQKLDFRQAMLHYISVNVRKIADSNNPSIAAISRCLNEGALSSIERLYNVR